jgi:hypothetical protein
MHKRSQPLTPAVIVPLAPVGPAQVGAGRGALGVIVTLVTCIRVASTARAALALKWGRGAPVYPSGSLSRPRSYRWLALKPAVGRDAADPALRCSVATTGRSVSEIERR